MNFELPRLDRTKFKIQTYEEADKTRSYWLSKTPEERLLAAHYLNSVCFNFDFQNHITLDRSKFSSRKHTV